MTSLKLITFPAINLVKYIIIFGLCSINLSAQVTSIPGATGTASNPTAGDGINVTGSTVSINDTITARRATVQAGGDNACVDTGGDDDYVCTLAVPIATCVSNMWISLKVTFANVGAATVNPGCGIKNILTITGSTPADNELLAGNSTILTYDGAAFRLPTTVTATAPYLTIAGSNYLPFSFLATLPPTTGWTDRNFATATFTTAGLGGAIAITSTVTQNSYNMKGVAIGATTRLIAAFTCSGGGLLNAYIRGGVGISRPGAAMLIAEQTFSSQDFRSGNFQTTRWTNPTTYLALSGPDGINSTTNPQYVRIDLGASGATNNITISLSNTGDVDTGADWTMWSQTTQTNAIGGAYASTDEWVFGASGNGTYADRCKLLSWRTY